jgi:hypothetical protein
MENLEADLDMHDVVINFDKGARQFLTYHHNLK